MTIYNGKPTARTNSKGNAKMKFSPKLAAELQRFPVQTQVVVLTVMPAKVPSITLHSSFLTELSLQL